MLIGLVGNPGSGKSAVRFMLEKQFGFEVINVKIPIIRACYELTGVPFEQFTTQAGKEQLYKGVPLRNLMGEVGAVMERMFGVYHTIDIGLQGYDLINGNFVVDSLRMEQPLSFPGKVVEIVSERSINTGNYFDQYDRTRIDYTINNDGTIGELEPKIARMLDCFCA